VFSSFYDLKDTKLHKFTNVILSPRGNGKQYALEEYRKWHFARTEKMNQPAFDKKDEEPDDQISIYDFDLNGEKESDGK
jgi:hypothetical protein